MLGTAGEVRMISYTKLFHGLILMDTPVLTVRQRVTYISSERTLDTI